MSPVEVGVEGGPSLLCRVASGSGSNHHISSIASTPPASPRVAPLGNGVSLLEDSNLDQLQGEESNRKVESRKRTALRTLAAATISLTCFNLDYVWEDATWPPMISNFGIILGSALAFPPTKKHQVVKIVVPALGMQLALLPQLLLREDNEYKKESYVFTCVIYSTCLSILWYMAERNPQHSPRQHAFRRIGGAITAVGIHKLCQIVYPQGWDKFFGTLGNVGIAAGNMVAFPPERRKLCNSFKVLVVSIPLLGLATWGLEQNHQSDAAFALSSLCSTIFLATIWYDGRRNLLIPRSMD